MTDSQEFLENASGIAETEEGSQAKKLKFTPPVLHKYGEVVKICQAATVQGQNDFFTS